MLRLLPPHCLPLLGALLSCSLLPCCSLPGSPGQAWRPAAGGGGARDAAARLLLLESVKAGILSSLGMEREPRVAAKASDEDLRRMYALYGERLRLLTGNSSEPMEEVQGVKKRRFTVLFPETVEPVRDVPHEGRQPEPDQRMQWYRAVFNGKNYNTHTDLTPVRAKLKISSRRLEAGPPMASLEIRVTVHRAGLLNTTVRVAHAAAWRRGRLSVDLRAAVESWWSGNAAAGGVDERPLEVELGFAAGDGEGLEAAPSVALEVGLAAPRAGRPRRARGTRRLPRSAKEDACGDEGWCCRKSLTVSFKDVGWSDWVVAPVSYTMHYCQGSCPHNYKPAATHTQVKSRLHQLTKGATPGPCCVPAAYEPLVLMHYDSRGILTLTPFHDLIVSRCYCA